MLPSSPSSSNSPASKQVRQWWKRAKDRCSICLVRACLNRHHRSGICRNPDLEAAIIKATNHDDAKMDYKNVGRVLSWAKISPVTTLGPLNWALSRRLERTRDWVVALKGLMLVHSLLRSEGFPATRQIDRLPFDLSNFHPRSSSWKFASFVRAYFDFLDHRSMLLSEGEVERDETTAASLVRLQRMQDLLDLLMQITPTGDGMEIPLILEAMDCVIIEILDVYGRICRGIAGMLINVLPSSSSSSVRTKGVGILRRATEQSLNISRFFEVCKGLGVTNASQLPALEIVPDEDITDLERLVMECPEEEEEEEEEEEQKEESKGDLIEKVEEEERRDWSESTGGSNMEATDKCYYNGESSGTTTAVVTRDWVVFKDDNCGTGGGRNGSNNPFLNSPPLPPSSYLSEELPFSSKLRHRLAGGIRYHLIDD